jgi:hypothetical protein
MGMDRIAAALFLSGVAIFFASCEREELGNVQGNIAVNFTIGDVDYGASEAAVRGAGRKLGSETVVAMPDGWQLHATLEEEAADPLRAEVIPVNNRLRIVAYKKNGGTYAYDCDAEYVVAAGGIEPVAEHPVGLLLTSTGTYKFVAYSLNTTSVPTYAASIGALSPGDCDLLWGDTGDIVINADNNDVNINMKHKFSRVGLEVTTAFSSGAPLIDAVSAEMPGYKALLTVASGAMATNGGFTQSYLSSEWAVGTTTATSDPHLVFTGGDNPISVKITSLTVGGMAYTTTVPAFKFGMELETGHRYTLKIDFRKIIFAGSNVYWKWRNDGNHTLGGYLTFDAPTTDVGTNSTQKKQGVFFRWGSLIGISPAGSEGTAYSSSTTKAYVPDFTSEGVSDWKNPDTFQFELSGIPHVGGEYHEGDRYSTYLSDDGRNTSNDYTYWKRREGDICRYISENGYGPEESGVRYRYRMPTSYELVGTEELYAYTSGGWTKTPATTWGNETGNAEGTSLLTHYVSNKGTIFPASGYRVDGGQVGILHDVGKVGYYLASSALLATAEAALNYGFYFRDTDVSSAQYGGTYCFAVRCVRR